MRYIANPLTLAYTHVVYRGCGTEDCANERSDDAPYSWTFCPLCGNRLVDITVPLVSHRIGTAT